MAASTAGPLMADALGPRARRRVALASAVAAVVVGLLVAMAVARLAGKGQLAAERWAPFGHWKVWRFLLFTGMANTLKAALAAMVLAMAVGVVMATGRLSRRLPLRWLATSYVEFFRAVPLLLLIFFCAFGLPKYGVRLSNLGYLVLALVVYNGAVLGEIFRAGILSLDRGQREASLAVGLSESQTMRLVVLPQALRRMIPTIVSQLVTLLKDTTLGFVIPYEDLLRTGNTTGEFFHNPLQTLIVVAALYVAVNASLSQVARRLEVRQRSRLRAGALGVSGIEDLAAVDVTADARLR